jgi:hypothetical protein
MSQSRHGIPFHIFSMSEVEEKAKQLNEDLQNLDFKVHDAACEYSLYLTQKEYVERKKPHLFPKCHGLFVKDFQDFKEKLNIAIRALNGFYAKHRIVLSLLQADNPVRENFQEVEKRLQDLRNHYEHDKSLYASTDKPTEGPKAFKP